MCFLKNMLISNQCLNKYYPNFSANFLISGNKSLLSNNEVLILSKMVEPLGKNDDTFELKISPNIIDWVEVNSQNRPKKFLSGYKMFVKTSISQIKDKDLSVADVQQHFWENYTELSPFEVMQNWIKSINANNSFDTKKININPTLYNFSNTNWSDWASFKTPDTQPSKPKVDLNKCQEILDIKIYGDSNYKQILTNANKDKDIDILANDVIKSLALGNKEEKLRKKIMTAEYYNKNIQETHNQTKERYSDNNGKYCKNRLEIHKSILDSIFANSDAAKPTEEQQPTFIMLGGRGGSGKTKFSQNGNTKVYEKQNYIVLNSDEIKKKLPEYKGFNAFEVHEESWDILNKGLNLAIKKGLNVVLDGTMSNFSSNEKILKQFSDAGYNIEMYFMYLGRDKAAKRALNRFDYNNRYVPLNILLNMKDNEQNFDELKKYASKWAFYNNDVELDKDPILVDFETTDLLDFLLKNCSLDNV